MLEILPRLDSSHARCIWLLDSETLAALGATASEHGTTALGGHTGTEAMGLGTLTLIRLIRTLHLKFLLLHFEYRRDDGTDIDTEP